jgi:hypothetical protein
MQTVTCHKRRLSRLQIKGSNFLAFPPVAVWVLYGGQLRTQHADVFRRLDSNSNGLAAHLQDSDDDLVADLDLFLKFAREHQHDTHSFVMNCL